MKCLSCDCILTDFETTRKSATTGEYIDLCNECFRTIEDGVVALERDDLSPLSTREEIQNEKTE